MVLIADPQLVDPHTYPGRPWPLSTLTIWYTDLYIRKSFQLIQGTLSPDSVFFLGDLFDGGREWTTSSGGSDERESPDKRWRKYDTRYWMKEYRRFNRIFFDPWLRGDGRGVRVQEGRKLIAGLPGNHDLGLGGGIRIPVRKRFQAYFGNGNRFDIVGNHSFVSLDTVSLSAKGQPMSAGRQGITEQIHSQDVWSPVDQFLHTAKTEKARAIERGLRLRDGKPENEPLEHAVLELDDPRAHTISLENHKGTDIPSILLTHVPLYRAEGTPCGPLRERFPPSRLHSGEPMEKDEGNAIRVQAGLQYQNVLTPEISNEIVSLVGDVTHVFSGDDHDYCDVIHHGYTSKTGGIREITVKSISWAMGVRQPGFVLLSLWNPVDSEGKAIASDSTKATIQTHLCLLPDQLSIFIRYAWLLVLTLISLLVKSVIAGYGYKSTPEQANGNILPLTKVKEPRPPRRETISASARSSSSNNRLAVRPSAGRPRSMSPSNGYGYTPPAEEATANHARERPEGHMNGSSVDHGWNDVALHEPSHRKRTGRIMTMYEDFRSNVLQVATFVVLWYAWLLWNS